MSMPPITHCARRCEGLSGAFQPSALFPDLLVCRYCGETRRQPEQSVAALPGEPLSAPPTLFTIGYDGRRLEQVLAVLVAQRIQVLLDVRQHAWSANPGFVQETLRRALEGCSITYRHRPASGSRWSSVSG